MARPVRSRRDPRGSTLLELMIALAIMLVAIVGFIGAMREAMNATAVAHRRTESTLLRTGLIERLTTTRRSVIDGFADAARTWRIESCYDQNAKLLGSNTTFAAAYTCPDGAVYVRHIGAAPVPDATGADQRVWSVAIYVDRTDRPCTPDTRYQSVGCVGADLYLTD
jgi:Tfp pilus assembly protein PilV